MDYKNQALIAEKVDKFQKTVAVGLFVLALTYVVEVAQFLTTGQTAEILDDIGLGGGILVVLIVFPAFVRFMHLRFKNRKACLETEGFVLQAFKTASSYSFSYTFVFMVFLNAFMVFLEGSGTGFFPDFPPEFYLKTIMAVTLGVHSVSFFLINRESSEDDGFEGDQA